MKSLKQRLQDSSEITINFELDSSAVKAKPSELSDNGSQPALQTSGPGGSITGPSVTAGDVTMKASEKLGTEMDAIVGPEANEDVEKAKGDEGSLTTLTSPADVASTSTSAAASTALTPGENFAELPRINTDIFNALAVAVREHRLTRGSVSQSDKKVRPGFKPHSLNMSHVTKPGKLLLFFFFKSVFFRAPEKERDTLEMRELKSQHKER